MNWTSHRSRVEKLATALLWLLGGIMVLIAAVTFKQALDRYKEADDQFHKIVYPTETPG